MTQVSVCQSQSKLYSVHAPPPPPPGSFKKKGGGLTRPQLSEGGCWERGGDFFQGEGVQLSHNKLKSEIFNDKIVYKQKYFSL